MKKPAKDKVFGKPGKWREDIQKQAAVLESHKLADEKWIYESPDGGETVFRRPFADYDSKNKEHINWETKKPTGRTFDEWSSQGWKSNKNQLELFDERT